MSYKLGVDASHSQQQRTDIVFSELELEVSPTDDVDTVTQNIQSEFKNLNLSPSTALGSLYTSAGEKLSGDFRNTEEGSDLYFVPADRYFMWPFKNTGHTVQVTGLDNHSTVLEALSAEPRAFFLHDFITDEECAMLINGALQRTGVNGMGPSTTGPDDLRKQS